jgi:hypothetical protein
MIVWEGFQTQTRLTKKIRQSNNKSIEKLMWMGPMLIFFFSNLFLYGLKFHDMLGQHTCIDIMGGFLDSNMTQTKNLKIKYSLVILSKPKNKARLLVYLTLLISDMWMGPTLIFFQFVLLWTWMEKMINYIEVYEVYIYIYW